MRIHLVTLNIINKIMVGIAMILFSTVILAQTHHVEISQFEFKPSLLEVKHGDTVIFTNRDIVPHTATAADLSWDTGDIASGESKQIKVEKDMYWDYFCKYHVAMKGQLRN